MLREIKHEEFDGTISARGARKAAGFVKFCDAFDIPVLTLTNVTGFKATLCSEKMIAKAVGEMIHAFADATVPKVNVIIGKAYGTAYVAMNSKSVGARSCIRMGQCRNRNDGCFHGSQDHVSGIRSCSYQRESCSSTENCSPA